MPISEFIQTHDRNKLAAPLGTEFLFRKEEMDAAMEKLAKSDILLIFDLAGTCKTRLALELCKNFSQEQRYYTWIVRYAESPLLLSRLLTAFLTNRFKNRRSEK